MFKLVTEESDLISYYYSYWYNLHFVESWKTINFDFLLKDWEKCWTSAIRNIVITRELGRVVYLYSLLTSIYHNSQKASFIWKKLQLLTVLPSWYVWFIIIDSTDENRAC